ncbi:MAG: M56 family metallopeptidase, partial [Bacteroidales bacterium]|nr:M56 family metallopeptidase [Bacteroidales bacterium]
MTPLLQYEIKVAVALAVFYMFYRLLLKKETFHRLNRAVLLGTAALSFLLPFCIVTIRKPVESAAVTAPETVLSDLTATTVLPPAEAAAPWWQTAFSILFWAGAAFVILRVTVSILSILRIVRGGETVGEEDGCRIIVTDRDIDPFSWMRFIVLSRQDWEGPHGPILAHEKAHIAGRHSAEVLLVDLLAAFQWFNPAIWMLRADLQEIHEYEADDAVLRGGADVREYQYLLIRKSVSKSGYSVAKSFNHSILKNRMTMMSKTRSPLSRGLRVL